MAEPELKSRSSRENVAKASSQEKMGGRYSARSLLLIPHGAGLHYSAMRSDAILPYAHIQCIVFECRGDRWEILTQK